MDSPQAKQIRGISVCLNECSNANICKLLHVVPIQLSLLGSVLPVHSTGGHPTVTDSQKG